MPVERVAKHRSASYNDRRRKLLSQWLPALIAVALAVTTWSLLLMDDEGVPRGGQSSTTSPPAAAAPGGRIHVALDAIGNIRVTVDVTWARHPESLSMSVPLESAYGLDPHVAIGLIEAGGVLVPPKVTLTAGQMAEIPLGAGVTRTRLEYAGTGTYVATTPSAPGRGLVLLTPLRVSDPGVDLRLDVSDDRILNLACRSASRTRACGTRTGSTWTVPDLEAGEDVVAQVDLVTTSWSGGLSVPPAASPHGRRP